MLDNITQDSPLAGLREKISRSETVTSELLLDVIAQACMRRAVPNSEKRKRIGKLIEAEAWIDATLALIDLELPQWTLRSLDREDGEWYCALSKQWQLPDWLDETIESHHREPALAILGALVEAQDARLAAARSAPCHVPACRPAPGLNGNTVCCDNFS